MFSINWTVSVEKGNMGRERSVTRHERFPGKELKHGCCDYEKVVANL